MTHISKLYSFAICILLALILWGVSGSLAHGPKAKPADAPSDQFSALRAFEHLTDMVGNNKPHPTGSAENTRVLGVIKDKFEALGYDVEIQAALGCTLHYPGCGQIENIIVRLKGSGDGSAIMVTTHYDSVPAGPAAADDGAGTAAIIEIARILKDAPQMQNDVIFLVTDGEEGGLRGAAAYANKHPDYADVKLVINMESRGVSGPSSMFETASGNLDLVRTFASNNPHPVSTSLAYEVYQRIPNDTDYSIYKEKGTAGLNFAFTGDVHLYHSLYDDADHLDKTSLQHHGDNALSAIRAFGNKDISGLIGDANASYIDVFGQKLLVWPSAWNLPLSLLSLVLLAAGFAKTRPRKFWDSLAAVTTIAIVTLLAGWVLSFPLGRWPDLFYLDHPYPWAGRVAMIFAAAFVSWGMVQMYQDRITRRGLVWASALLFSVIAAALSVTVPGVAYVFLFPALALSLGYLIDVLRSKGGAKIAILLGVAIGGYIAFYHFLVLEVIAPYKAGALRIAPLLILGMILAPLWISTEKYMRPSKALRSDDEVLSRRNTIGAVFAVLAVIATVVSFLLPGFNATHPRAHNIVYMDGFDGPAQWASEVAERQDSAFVSQAKFSQENPIENSYGSLWPGSWTKAAPAGKYPQPHYRFISSNVSGGNWMIEFEMSSAAHGYGMSLGFDRDNPPHKVWINGEIAGDYTGTGKPYKSALTFRGPKDDVFTVRVSANPDQDITMAIIDTFNLSAAELEGMNAMRSQNSAPGFYGDRALIARRVTISCSDHCNNGKSD